ncbi:MAG: DUF234 domain-containing protein [Lachnospiraceae bacterium]
MSLSKTKRQSIISRGAKELAYQRIEPHISDYMGSVFEEICKQYVWNELLSVFKKWLYKRLYRSSKRTI